MNMQDKDVITYARMAELIEIAARKMYEDFNENPPTCTLFLCIHVQINTPSTPVESRIICDYIQDKLDGQYTFRSYLMLVDAFYNDAFNNHKWIKGNYAPLPQDLVEYEMEAKKIWIKDMLEELKANPDKVKELTDESM